MEEQGVEGAAAVQKRFTYGYDNSYIVDSTDRYHDRLVPVVVLDAEDDKTPALLHELIEHHGLAAARFSGTAANDGTFPWLSSPRALRTWAAAEETGLVVDILLMPRHGFPSGVDELARLARAHPRVTVVLDHVGLPDLRATGFGLGFQHRMFAREHNAYCKVTTMNLDLLREAQLPASDFIKAVVEGYGPERVMWGSDLGNSAGDYRELVGRILAATTSLQERDRHRILHGTAKTVFVRGGHRT
jgi:L-fuconolactonase